MSRKPRCAKVRPGALRMTALQCDECRLSAVRAHSMQRNAMDTEPRATPTPSAPPGPARRVRVWDLPTRLFHWLTVLLVALAYVSQRMNWMQLHVLAGETLL